MAFNPTAPAAALYNIFPQAYAQSLAATTGDPTADAVNRLTLGQMSRGAGGLGNYEALIRDANEKSFTDSRAGYQKERDVAWMQQLANLIKVGAGGAVLPPNSDYAIDPTAIRKADALGIQSVQATNMKDASAALQSQATAGVEPDVNLYRGVTTTPYEDVIQPAPDTGYITQNDRLARENDAIQAKAAATNATAAVQRAANGEGGNTKTEKTYLVGKDGKPVLMGITVTDKGGFRVAPLAQSPGTPPPVAAPNAGTAATGGLPPTQKYYTDASGMVQRNPNYRGP